MKLTDLRNSQIVCHNAPLNMEKEYLMQPKNIIGQEIIYLNNNICKYKNGVRIQ